MRLLRNSSLRDTAQTHYVIVHAVVLEMINTKSESESSQAVGRVNSCRVKQARSRVVGNSHMNLKKSQKSSTEKSQAIEKMLKFA